jgi:hypothetical protein
MYIEIQILIHRRGHTFVDTHTRGHKYIDTNKETHRGYYR